MAITLKPLLCTSMLNLPSERVSRCSSLMVPTGARSFAVSYSAKTFLPSCLRGEFGNLTSMSLLVRSSRSKRVSRAPRASKDDVPDQGFRYPPMKKKPAWWWRILAAIPYLLPLHEAWVFAETSYNLYPLMEYFEFHTYAFLDALAYLPSWFFMAYFFGGYLGIVRRKEWPHFFRFHLVMSMLVEIFFQVIGMVNTWLPDGLYWGKIGMYFWTFVGVAYFFTVLICMMCALSGKYADVPFVADAAYIQIPVD